MEPGSNHLDQGSLKDTFCPVETWLFHQNKCNHHLQGNLQVYNVRIPVDSQVAVFCSVTLAGFSEYSRWKKTATGDHV